MLDLRSISPHTLIIIILLLVPMAVRPTSPLIPYHDFHVSGSIERAGGPLNNYTVALAVKGRFAPDEYTIIREGPQPYALTSETGQFWLSASIYDYIREGDADTLAVAVLVPGDDFIMGKEFARNTTTTPTRS
jgi:hypothetical protein